MMKARIVWKESFGGELEGNGFWGGRFSANLIVLSESFHHARRKWGTIIELNLRRMGPI